MQHNTPQQPNTPTTTPATDANSKQATDAAHTEAEKDMEDDADLNAAGPNDDLDEEESARLADEGPMPI